MLGFTRPLSPDEERELLARHIRQHADPLWRDQHEARRLGLHEADRELGRIVEAIHEVGRKMREAGSATR